MKLYNLLTLSLLLTTLVGCAEKEYIASVNTISNANTVAQIKRVVDKRVDTDQVLTKALQLLEVRKSNTNDGYRRIQVFLKNCTGDTYTIMYRFNWYDENGAEVENPDNEMWVRKIIVAGDDVTLTSIAPEKNCKDFKLRLKAVE
jgi:uncharacterized protein YcfL